MSFPGHSEHLHCLTCKDKWRGPAAGKLRQEYKGPKDLLPPGTQKWLPGGSRSRRATKMCSLWVVHLQSLRNAFRPTRQKQGHNQKRLFVNNKKHLFVKTMMITMAPGRALSVPGRLAWKPQFSQSPTGKVQERRCLELWLVPSLARVRTRTQVCLQLRSQHTKRLPCNKETTPI